MVGIIGFGKFIVELLFVLGMCWNNGIEDVYLFVYGMFKVMGEWFCKVVGVVCVVNGGKLLIVLLCIGWVLFDENDFNDINYFGIVGIFVLMELFDEVSCIVLCWFCNMWFLNGDLCWFFLCFIMVDLVCWLVLVIVVNGVLNNRGMDWGLEIGCELLGYDF